MNIVTLAEMRACFIWDKGCGKPRKRIMFSPLFLLSDFQEDNFSINIHF